MNIYSYIKLPSTNRAQLRPFPYVSKFLDQINVSPNFLNSRFRQKVDYKLRFEVLLARPLGFPCQQEGISMFLKKRNRSFSTPSRFPQLVGISHSIVVFSSINAAIVIVTLCRHHPQHHLHQVMIQTVSHLTMTMKKKSKRQNQQPKCHRTMRRIILIQPWEVRIYVFYLEWQLAAILAISQITRTRRSPSQRHTTPK